MARESRSSQVGHVVRDIYHRIYTLRRRGLVNINYFSAKLNPISFQCRFASFKMLLDFSIIFRRGDVKVWIPIVFKLVVWCYKNNVRKNNEMYINTLFDVWFVFTFKTIEWRNCLLMIQQNVRESLKIKLKFTFLLSIWWCYESLNYVLYYKQVFSKRLSKFFFFNKQ